MLAPSSQKWTERPMNGIRGGSLTIGAKAPTHSETTVTHAFIRHTLIVHSPHLRSAVADTGDTTKLTTETEILNLSPVVRMRQGYEHVAALPLLSYRHI